MEQKDALEQWADEVVKRHCWALGEKTPCTLTREQGHNLTMLGMQLARARGYDNGGTGHLGMHPSQDVPLVSYEMYLADENTWYTVVMLVDWQKSTAKFYSAHKGTTYDYGCKVCEELRENYSTQERRS